MIDETGENAIAEALRTQTLHREPGGAARVAARVSTRRSSRRPVTNIRVANFDTILIALDPRFKQFAEKPKF